MKIGKFRIFSRKKAEHLRLINGKSKNTVQRISPNAWWYYGISVYNRGMISNILSSNIFILGMYEI